MKKSTHSFSFHRIRSRDYTSDFASGATLIPPLVFYVMFNYLGLETNFLSLKELIIIPIVAGIIVLLFRRHFFYVLYTRGVDVDGHIVFASEFKRGGSRVEYKYEHLGENYWTGNTLTSSAFRKYRFREGDEVVLRIDPKKPKRAVIKELYF